jgi:signal transduction histidine kinase
MGAPGTQTSALLPGGPGVDRAVDVVLVALVAASVARYMSRHAWSGSTAWVLAGALALAAGYLAGRAVRPARRAAWLTGVCLLWLGLVLVAPSFGWCAVALAFSALRVLPYRAAVAVVVGLVAAVSVAWLRLSDPFDPTVVLGPACLALLAVGAYRALERDAAAQQAVLADLRRTQDELAVTQRREGALAERHRLSREFHDSVAQDLTRIDLLLHASEQDWSGRPEAARDRVQRAAATARDGLAEVRRVVHDLGPDGLDDDTVGQVLRQLADEMAGDSGVAVETGRPGRGPAAAAGRYGAAAHGARRARERRRARGSAPGRGEAVLPRRRGQPGRVRRRAGPADRRAQPAGRGRRTPRVSGSGRSRTASRASAGGWWWSAAGSGTALAVTLPLRTDG